MRYQRTTLLEVRFSGGSLRHNLTILHLVRSTYNVGIGEGNYDDKCTKGNKNNTNLLRQTAQLLNY